MVGMIGAVLGSAAQSYRLEGTIGGKIPIVIEMEDYEENLLGGRYAYKSTLDKYGDVDCSWLVIDENYDVPESEWTVFDCKKQPVEVWYNLNFMDRKHLTAWMTNKAGKTYQVVAHVVSPAVSKESLVPYYKQHIGEMVCDFDMFNYLPVKFRLIHCMDIENYFALKNIYQTQGDIEYSKGMFWGSGFMARQCCDPATVWAYDTYSNSFYVWIRKDDRDYWWSKSGDIPIKFREIVSERF